MPFDLHYHHFIKLKVSMKSSHSNWVQLVLQEKCHYFVMRHHNLGSPRHSEMGQM